MKHSPGPWTNDGGGRIRDAKGRKVASTKFGDGASSMKISIEEARANEELIAAAPSLLKELKRFLRQADRLGTCLGDANLPDAARAAIKSAGVRR